MSSERAERYARGLMNLTRLVKMVVEKKRMASLDYTKDEVYKTAMGE